MKKNGIYLDVAAGGLPDGLDLLPALPDDASDHGLVHHEAQLPRQIDR